MFHRSLPLALLLLLPILAGCGGKYTTYRVSGKVTLRDGTPLEGLSVVFQCQEPAITATGTTDAGGNYRLGTVEPGDGAPAGTYRVAVTEPQGDDPENPQPPRIDPKYGSFQTSGLKFTVEPGGNTFDIPLDRAGGR